MATTLVGSAASSQKITLPAFPELFASAAELDALIDSLVPGARVPHKRSLPQDGAEEEPPKNPMMEALQATTHQTLTDNGAPAVNSTLSPTLDAFQALGPYAKGDNICKHLESAWEEDPNLTLRIIWNTRSLHDGKSEKEVFYQAWGWLYKYHPCTAIRNLHLLVDPVCTRPNVEQALPHGYWKDLLNILALAALDQLGPSEVPSSFLHNHTPSKKDGESNKLTDPDAVRAARVQEAQEAHAALLKKFEDKTFKALYVTIAQLFAEQLAKDVDIMKRLNETPKEDDEQRKELVRSLSLAGKWAPTPNCSHDRVTNIASAISLLLHRSQVLVPPGVTIADGPVGVEELRALRVHLQRSILTPLRKTLSLPEPLMSSNRWTDIKYGRVASMCMKNNTERFYAHDKAGFAEYLTAVEDGKRSISGATLLPHELVKQMMSMDSGRYVRDPTHKQIKEELFKIRTRVIDQQWKTLIGRLRESGAIENSLGICDVSGSMMMTGGSVEPIYVSIALSIVLAQLAKPPFNNGFVTFSKDPQFVKIDPEADGIAKTINDMVHQHWGMNTDLHAVFVRLLLPLAIKNNVKQEDMIKRLFIFSDMQFDEAIASEFDEGSPRKQKDPANWQTNHDEIEKAYRAAGYEVPEIVYWNLAAPADKGLRAMPVTGDKKGVALLNGFSPNLLKVFMGEVEEAAEAEAEPEEQWEKVEEESLDASTVVEVEKKVKEAMTPVDVMKKALAVKSYDGLVVVD